MGPLSLEPRSLGPLPLPPPSFGAPVTARPVSAGQAQGARTPLAITALRVVLLSLLSWSDRVIAVIARAITAISHTLLSTNSCNSELKYSGSYSCH
jgi:hypothetical protein